MCNLCVLQHEGAAFVDGKSVSIWDAFALEDGLCSSFLLIFISDLLLIKLIISIIIIVD